jgi:transcriptional regulator GlxA family with amidase domain
MRSTRQIVHRASEFLRRHAGEGVRIGEVSRAAGISERALRNAFYVVRGMGPKRCLLAERLQGVRRALRDSDRTRSTVTSIATGYGFYELGRFAATYKEAFGEAPSETLRR